MSSLKGKNGNGNKNKINREFLEKKWPILIKYPNIEILKEKIRAKSKDRKRKSYVFVQSTPINRNNNFQEICLNLHFLLVSFFLPFFYF
jgi:hypothetical protein